MLLVSGKFGCSGQKKAQEQRLISSMTHAIVEGFCLLKPTLGHAEAGEVSDHCKGVLMIKPKASLSLSECGAVYSFCFRKLVLAFEDTPNQRSLSQI